MKPLQRIVISLRARWQTWRREVRVLLLGLCCLQFWRLAEINTVATFHTPANILTRKILILLMGGIVLALGVLNHPPEERVPESLPVSPPTVLFDKGVEGYLKSLRQEVVWRRWLGRLLGMAVGLFCLLCFLTTLFPNVSLGRVWTALFLLCLALVIATGLLHLLPSHTLHSPALYPLLHQERRSLGLLIEAHQMGFGFCGSPQVWQQIQATLTEMLAQVSPEEAHQLNPRQRQALRNILTDAVHLDTLHSPDLLIATLHVYPSLGENKSQRAIEHLAQHAGHTGVQTAAADCLAVLQARTQYQAETLLRPLVSASAPPQELLRPAEDTETAPELLVRPATSSEEWP